MTKITQRKKTDSSVVDSKSTLVTGNTEEPSQLRSTLELLGCTLAIYVCYLVYGILHERLTRQPYITSTGEPEKFTHTLFLTTIQCFGNGIWAILLIFIEAKRRQNVHHNASFFSKVYDIIFDSVPKQKYALISFSYFAAMASSSAALKFVSYPIQALAKSSKLIPVMVGRILKGHVYSTREYAHVFLITGGIATFFLFEGKTSTQTSSIIGFVLLGFSLIMDAITGPTQEQVSHIYHPTVQSMTFWINFFPCVIMTAVILFTGELAAAIDFCTRHPHIYYEIALYCLMSAIGQSVIVWTVVRFNSMTVTIITTTRKFFTILASVFWFQNTLAFMQWVGVVFVFAGIAGDSQYKFTKKKQIHKEIVKEHRKEVEVNNKKLE